MAISIMLFDDNEGLRSSLVSLLSGVEGYEVLSHHPHAADAGPLVEIHQPDVVLMDIDMPGEGGIVAVRKIKEARPGTSVIMYTVFEDDEKLFQSLCAGANGYLLKKTPTIKLIDAIREVLEGGAPMSPSIARKVLATFQQKTQTRKYNLSPRELEVLQLLAKGYSIKMIASELRLAFDTIRSHLKNIYQKLHVNCGKEAIAKALGEHIV